MKQRDDLTGEHGIGDAGQIAGALVFFGVWTADSFVFKWTVSLNSILPPAVRIPAGLFFLCLSLYFSGTGLAVVFGEIRETPAVIRKKVFSLVRHPVYLGEILLYLAFLLFSVSLSAAAVILLIIGFLHFLSRHEESLLLDRFGAEYRNYMKEVPMWVPRIEKKDCRVPDDRDGEKLKNS